MASGLRMLFLSGVLLLLAGCFEPPYTNVDNVGLERLIESGVPVVDVRRPEEWRETGTVEGSERLTFVDASGRVQPDFLNRLSDLADKDQPIALICRTGNRTDVLARHLVERMGYTRVYNVRDGISGWIGAGRPVDRG